MSKTEKPAPAKKVHDKGRAMWVATGRIEADYEAISDASKAAYALMAERYEKLTR